jgi:predicted Zn-dependent peptidase
MIESLTLGNGLRLVAEPQPWQPGVSFELHIPAGAGTEPAEARGSTTVLEEWVYRGAGARDARELSDALDDLGVRRGGGAGVDGTTFGSAFLSGDLKAALAIYSDIILRPTLPEEEFGPVVDLARQDLEDLEDSPARKLFTLLRERYFTSPHGRSTLGTREGLDALTPAAVRADHARRFRPGGAVIGLAGGLDWEAVRALITDLFGEWEGAGPKLGPAEWQSGFYEHSEADTAQEQIGMLYPDVAPGAQGWYESRLALNILSGGGFSSRLMQEVREKRGLAYSVSASSVVMASGSALSVYAGTAPDRAHETLEVLQAEVARLKDGVTTDELERARTGLLTQLVMSEESSGARARGLVRDSLLFGRPRDVSEVRAAVQAVTLTSLNEYLASRPYPRPGILTLGPRSLEMAVLS